MNDHLLEARDLSHAYDASEGPVLKAVGFSVKPGTLTAVIGPSGSGKSTLLHILGGLLRPSAGCVLFNGTDLYGLARSARARLINESIGFVFQDHYLLPEFTALENVCLPALLCSQRAPFRSPPAVIKGRAAAWLGRFGLSHRLDHYPGKLSGGERQRVAVARALINDPAIVFCDEPTGDLDSRNAKALMAVFVELKEKLGRTLVVVSHDTGFTALADQTLTIKDGSLAPV